MEITINDLSKTYPNGVHALRNVQLDIKSGMLGLLGPNGAGKSTLMRTLATLQAPDQGNIHYNGISILEDPMYIRLKLGYLPQSFGVYPRASARQLLDYLGVLKGLSHRHHRKRKIEQVLAITNLLADGDKSVHQYSGGMKQRFGIAQLLLNDPELVIVDEPTAGLDPGERSRFLQLLRSIATDRIVIFSTHIVEDVKDLCTDLAILHQGTIKLHSTPQQALSNLVGSIWTTQIATEEKQVYSESFQLLSSQFNSDHSLQIRVFSTSQPARTFSQATPTLEDVYFTTIPEAIVL